MRAYSALGPEPSPQRMESKVPLVNDGVEGLVLEVLHGAHIHLLVDQVGVLVLVSLLHLLNSCSGDVNVSDGFVVVLVHLFSEEGVTGAHVEDLIVLLHVLRDDVLDAGVALVPVEGLLVLVITVLPVLCLAVLRHFLVQN